MDTKMPERNNGWINVLKRYIPNLNKVIKKDISDNNSSIELKKRTKIKRCINEPQNNEVMVKVKKEKGIKKCINEFENNEIIKKDISNDNSSIELKKRTKTKIGRCNNKYKMKMVRLGVKEEGIKKCTTESENNKVVNKDNSSFSTTTNEVIYNDDSSFLTRTNKKHIFVELPELFVLSKEEMNILFCGTPKEIENKRNIYFNKLAYSLNQQ